MRLLKLQLRPFGCFTDTALQFEQKPGSLHVIYGRNEAGKSTALRAIRGFLFGIPARSQDAFRHEGKTLRILGELERLDGTRMTLVRRKGNQKTLLSEQEQPVPESALLSCLGGVGAELFSTLFCLDHDMLLQGGADLLAGRGAMAESLFQAGTGLVGLRKILQSLDDEAEGLFKARGSLAPVNQALSAYEEARRQLREASVSPRDWKADQATCERVERELAEVRKQIDDARRSLRHLERMRVAFPMSVAYQYVQSQLGDLVAVAVLPPEVRIRRMELQRQERESGLQVNEATGRLAKLEAELSACVVLPGWLEQADEITRLVQRVDGFRNAKRDLPQVQAKRQALEREAQGILSALKPGLDLRQVANFRIPDLQKKRLQRVATQHGLLQEKCVHTQRAIARQEQRIAAMPENTMPLPVRAETVQLESVLESAQNAGGWDELLEREETKCLDLLTRAEKEFALLGLWQGKLEEVDLLRVPLPETVDRMDRELAELDTLAERASSRRAETLEELSRFQLELETARLVGNVPTEQELADLRQRRQDGWRLVKRSWLEKQPDPAAEAAYSSDHPLPEAYEQSVTQADAVADRLRREADRTARFVSLQTGIQDARSRLGDLEAEAQAAAAKRGEWTACWTGVWRQCEIVPSSPKEMRAWLVRQANLSRMVTEWKNVRESAGQSRTTRDRLCQQLRDALVAAGEQEILPTAKLSDLVRRGTTILRAAEEARRASLERRRACERAVEELGLLRSDGKEALEAFENCRKEWNLLMESLQLPITFQPEETSIVLERLDAMFGALRERESLETRIEEMESYLRQFQQEVANLTGRLLPELEGETPDLAAAHLHRQLSLAQSYFARRQALEKQAETEREVLQRVQLSLDQASLELRGLCDRSGCATLADLERQEELSETKRTLQREVEAQYRRLMDLAGGGTVEGLLGELHGVDADLLPSRIEEQEKHIQQLEETCSRLDQEVALARQRLADRSGTAKANQAAQDVQSALASLRSGVEQYMRARLASEILRRHMERYRERNQDPILKRAHELFPKLTLGSFTGVKVGLDDQDRVVLLGARGDGEEVFVDGMSSGTRDQLFLALRLASLERYLTSAEPIPLILDDVFINFDDDRNKAALRVLAGLCSQTQVIYFTHHTRLVELAREVMPAETLQVQLLEG